MSRELSFEEIGLLRDGLTLLRAERVRIGHSKSAEEGGSARRQVGMIELLAQELRTSEVIVR